MRPRPVDLLLLLPQLRRRKEALAPPLIASFFRSFVAPHRTIV
jgi:hypothetical protein